jgi:type I restriction enzyme, S subunit
MVSGMNTVEGWRKKTLRELVTINYGKSPANILVDDGSYPVVGTGGIYRSGNGYLYDGESVILGRKGTIDRVYFTKGRFWTIDTAYYLSDFEEAIPKWLYYALQSIDFRQMNEATGVPSLSRDLLYKIEISTPSKPEQTKIAEILTTVDQAIEQTESLIAKQQRIKTGLMQDLLTRGIDEHGNLRSEQTHKFKDSPLGRIPVEWEMTETKKVCSLITKGTTPRVRSEESPQYSIPYLRVQNLTFNGEINFSEEIAFIDSTTHHGELARSRVFPGDVLQNIVGPPLGKIGIVPADYPEWNVNQAIAIFRPNKYVSSKFLCHWFQTPVTRTWFDLNSKKTSGQQNLTLEHCQQLPIVLPSFEEQNRICSSITHLNLFQKIGRCELLSLRSLKNGLMQDLLTGKKRINALLHETEVPTL